MRASRWRTFWNGCRCSFRWLRIFLLALILLALAALTWLRFVGLPNFIRIRVVDELARRGVVANFRSLHFHWFRGLVAEDLRVAWGGTNGTRIQIAEADLDIAPPSWRSNSTLVRGVSVRRGSLVVPLPLTNAPPLDLRLDDVTAQVRFLPGDQWEVPRLSARLAGLQLELRATLTNTAALRRPRPASAAGSAAQQARIRLLHSLITELGSWTDASSARIQVNLDLDGSNLAAARGDFYLDVPSARTLHGNLEQLRFSLRAQPGSGPEDLATASVILEVAEVQTPRGGLSDLTFRAHATAPPGSPLPATIAWQARLGHLFLQGCRTRGLVLQGTTRLSPAAVGSVQPGPAFQDASLETDVTGTATRIEMGRPDPDPIQIHDAHLDLHFINRFARELPARIRGAIVAGAVRGSSGSTGSATLRLDLATRANATEAPPDIGWWAPAWPLGGEVDLELADLKSPRIEAHSAAADLTWRPPQLAVRRLDAELYGGRLLAKGALDLITREATLVAETTFDLHGFDGLLGQVSRENFTRYQWTAPPWCEAQARAIFPAWTNRHPDWEAEVKPTLRVDGRFKTGAGSFKEIPFLRAESSLSFDGATWRLPDLRTERPEGRQEIAVEYNEDTGEYRVDARGSVLPPVLKPVLGAASAEIVDLFEFRNGIEAEVSVWGPWTEGTGQSIRGIVTATNFSFRGQRFDRLEASASYTNRFLAAAPVHLTRDGGEVTAEGVGYDFADGRLWLTNATSTIDPLVASAAINPGFPEKIAPYRFANPPRIRAQGTVQPGHTDTADMVFDVAGGPFEFWRLKAESIETRLHWQGTTLILSNIQARFFGGSLAGGAVFDLQNPEDGQFHFDAQVRQSDLGDLLRSASGGRTNVTQGTFDLDLTVTSARTSDIHTWNGFGRAELRDGLLWDAPLFGFLSPVLNTIVPGLGNNRARAAEATFTLTNSVVHTRDLVISCPPAKLFYRGTVDFDQRVNAKVEAQVLADVVGMGPLFGLILRPLTKLFEFRVTGTLAQVDAEPLYVPKFLLLPLQPLRILRDLFGAGEGKTHSDTNAPPATADPPLPPLPPP